MGLFRRKKPEERQGWIKERIIPDYNVLVWDDSAEKAWEACLDMKIHARIWQNNARSELLNRNYEREYDQQLWKYTHELLLALLDNQAMLGRYTKGIRNGIYRQWKAHVALGPESNDQLGYMHAEIEKILDVQENLENLPMYRLTDAWNMLMDLLVEHYRLLRPEKLKSARSAPVECMQWKSAESMKIYDLYEELDTLKYDSSAYKAIMDEFLQGTYELAPLDQEEYRSRNSKIRLRTTEDHYYIRTCYIHEYKNQIVERRLPWGYHDHVIMKRPVLRKKTAEKLMLSSNREWMMEFLAIQAYRLAYMNEERNIDWVLVEETDLKYDRLVMPKKLRKTLKKRFRDTGR